MRYNLSTLPLQTLMSPVAEATGALVRLDERIARSAIGGGWIARQHFADACASLWIDGKLVHLEDLVLHDAGADIRAPTHELTTAHAVLRARRRIAAHPPGWALTIEALRALRGEQSGHEDKAIAPIAEPAEADDMVLLAAELASIDAALARSSAVLAGAPPPVRRVHAEPRLLVYDQDWDEQDRLAEWRRVLVETEGLPTVLRVALLLDAWTRLEVLQHVSWLGRLLAASLLRETGVTAAHLCAVNLGLKAVARERRANRDRDTRLLAFLSGMSAAAEAGLKDCDRLILARQVMERHLGGRRRSSKLPELIDLVLARPMVSAGMIADALGVTPQGALKMVGELNLRELTGRDRFRAWGVL